MPNNKFYSLPDLPYGDDELAPVISKEQLSIHHQKHHAAYVKGANAILERLDQARAEKIQLDLKAETKALSFNIGGHLLHSLFWENLTPVSKGGGKPEGKILEKIKEDFGDFETFKNEFGALALGIEGSGWGTLVYHKETERLLCAPIEKHNVLLTPGAEILLVLDVFEHAYYLDYQNDRAKFIEAFWNIVNWEEANKRFENILS